MCTSVHCALCARIGVPFGWYCTEETNLELSACSKNIACLCACMSLCLRVCVCVCVCVHVCVSACVCVCTRTRAGKCVQANAFCENHTFHHEIISLHVQSKYTYAVMPMFYSSCAWYAHVCHTGL